MVIYKIKHGLVLNPFVYPHSSIHEYKKKGVYCEDWGVTKIVEIEDDFGE